MSLRLGDTVLITFDAYHAEIANKRRADFARYYRQDSSYAESGYIAHVGNDVRAGDVYPASVVRLWSGGLVNLQIRLDGNDTYWATSVPFSAEEQPWTWRMLPHPEDCPCRSNTP